MFVLKIQVSSAATFGSFKHSLKSCSWVLFYVECCIYAAESNISFLIYLNYYISKCDHITKWGEICITQKSQLSKPKLKISLYPNMHYNLSTTRALLANVSTTFNSTSTTNSRNTHMSECCSSCHDRSLVDWHCILSVIRNDSMARLVVSSDGFIFLINFYTSPFRPLKEGKQTHSYSWPPWYADYTYSRVQSSRGTACKQNLNPILNPIILHLTSGSWCLK